MKTLAPSQAVCPISFEQGRAAAANLYEMVAEEGRVEGRAEERGRIAGLLLERGETDLALELLDHADKPPPA